MNKNLILGILGFGIVAILGYSLISNTATNNQTQTQITPAAEEQISATPSPTSVSLNEHVVTISQQNDSGISGTATLVEENEKVKVTLKLTGAQYNMTGSPQDITQPAHIHVGKCPNVGAVKYPLNPAVGGVSETMLDVTLEQLRLELPLAINVHKSAKEAGIYISCGDLTL